jgi:hypothetical protein
MRTQPGVSTQVPTPGKRPPAATRPEAEGAARSHMKTAYKNGWDDAS